MKLPDLSIHLAMNEDSIENILKTTNFSVDEWEKICTLLKENNYKFDKSDSQCFPYACYEIDGDLRTSSFKIEGVELRYCWNKQVGWNNNSGNNAPVNVFIAPGVIGIVIEYEFGDSGVEKIFYKDNEESFLEAYCKIGAYITSVN